MKKEYRYYAFISYKREDEKWAEWLQRKLESFSLPVALRREDSSLPERIRPVFRDQSELSGGNLKEEIEKALEESRYIIVICSPRAAGSPWVSKEVGYFIDNGREDCIIPFIIGGTPNAAVPEEECYPTSLRNLKGEREILGININEMGRDAAVIKTIARMFGLRFDTLWQRHKRARMRRNVILGAALAAIFLATIAFAAVLLNKNNLIESQNERLTTLVNELKEESITYSELPADRKRYTHVSTLRGRNEGWPLEYVAFHPTEPIVAFSDNWGYWVNYLRSNVEVLLTANGKEIEVGDVCDMGFSEDGLELWAQSNYMTYCWNTNTLGLSRQYTLGDVDSEDETVPHTTPWSGYLWESEDFVKYHYDGSILEILDYTGKVICSTQMPANEDSRMRQLKNPVFDEVLLISDSRAAVFDKRTGEFVQFFRGYNPNKYRFSENGNYLIVENNVFERIQQVDTLRNFPYERFPKQDFPGFTSEVRYDYDPGSNSTLEFDENSIHIRRGSSVRTLDVIRIYTTGNGQEWLSDALYAGPNKIIAIVEQGDIRVFNAGTLALMGILENFTWLGNGIGNEENMAHAEAFIADSKYINGRLWVLSSGGVLRIYNVERLQTETVIELPCDPLEFARMGCLDNFFIEDDGSRIHYSFSNDSLYYTCDLRSMNP